MMEIYKGSSSYSSISEENISDSEVNPEWVLRLPTPTGFDHSNPSVTVCEDNHDSCEGDTPKDNNGITAVDNIVTARPKQVPT